jgi:hypothetical protein
MREANAGSRMQMIVVLVWWQLQQLGGLAMDKATDDAETTWSASTVENAVTLHDSAGSLEKHGDEKKSKTI